MKWVALLAILLVLSGCTWSARTEEPPGEPQILYDLAGMPGDGCRVYLEENGSLTPYLVLTGDYDGACYLLREHVLDEQKMFNDQVAFAAYYGDSCVDRYLNEEFITVFAQPLQDAIVTTQLEITAKSSMPNCGREITVIPRKIFLPSYAEMGYDTFLSVLQEGQDVGYFSSDSERAARFADGNPAGWWLRSPMTTETVLVCAMGTKGNLAVTGVYDIYGNVVLGVRPALCLAQDTPVVRTDLQGREVWTIGEKQE